MIFCERERKINQYLKTTVPVTRENKYINKNDNERKNIDLYANMEKKITKYSDMIFTCLQKTKLSSFNHKAFGQDMKKATF